METFSLNLNASAVRHDKMEGRDYLVAPMVMLTAGVHAGSNGPLFYPPEELQKTPGVWNKKPVTVYHPEANGESVSACDPDVLTARGVGVIMNTRYSGGKLRAEAWLDESRLKAVDSRILDAIANNQMLELSTGLFTENDQVEGEYQGKKYAAVARNYKPDHLAILPDKKGACSIADGAGFLRNERITVNHITANDKSFDDIRCDLYGLLPQAGKANEPAPYICDVFDGYCVYENNGKLYQQDYSIDKDDVISLAGMPIEVVRFSEYRRLDGKPVGNAAPIKETPNMAKKETIDGIIANGVFVEGDRAFLEGLSDERLVKFVAKAAPAPAPVANAKPETPPAPVVNTAPAPVAPPTLDQYISNAPAELQDVLRSGIAAHGAQKTALVTAITANARNVFTAEYLNTKSISELQGIAALAGTAPVANANPPMFHGAAAPAGPVANAKPETPLPRATLNFTDKVA